MTSGVPWVANSQKKAASAGVIPMQPRLPGIPHVPAARQEFSWSAGPSAGKG